jgi:hypothetical protein
MIFGDEKRMGGVDSGKRGLSAHKNRSSAEQGHLGPGSYFTAHNENIRAGWIKRSFSNRQPMLPGQFTTDRNHHYTGGVLVDAGIAQGRADGAGATPGPGHYHMEYDRTVGRPQEVSYHGSFDPYLSQNYSKSGQMKSGSSRLINPSATLKDGVFFQGKGSHDDNHLGPGQYVHHGFHCICIVVCLSFPLRYVADFVLSFGLLCLERPIFCL